MTQDQQEALKIARETLMWFRPRIDQEGQEVRNVAAALLEAEGRAVLDFVRDAGRGCTDYTVHVAKGFRRKRYQQAKQLREGK